MAVTVWPAKDQNWKFCTLLYHARKLDCLPFRTEFLFSWLEKLAYYLSWQENQAQLNFVLSGAKLKSQKLSIFSGDISKLCKLAKIASKLVPMHSLQDSTLILRWNIESTNMKKLLVINFLIKHGLKHRAYRRVVLVRGDLGGLIHGY